jgi:ABC-type bacteriocin/lantibiotic exporter with double-glycine peptidase domain
MNRQSKKFVAAAGLGSMLLFAVIVLGGMTLFSSPDEFKRFRSWWMGGEYLGSEGVVLQDKQNNCGPAALKMVFDYYGIPSTLAEIEQSVGLTAKGSSMLALKEMAELKGLRAEGWRYTLKDFLKAQMPVIVFVNGDHFAVVDSITEHKEILMRDPALGRLKLPAKRLPNIWNGETLVFGKQ